MERENLRNRNYEKFNESFKFIKNINVVQVHVLFEKTSDVRVSFTSYERERVNACS